jgi:hypothetical protein
MEVLPPGWIRMKQDGLIIDVHMHVGHRFEWTERAREVWMDTGPYVPRLFDGEGRQLSNEYGAVIKDEAWAGILIPEYSPKTAGTMPFERALEINRLHPELVPIANLNPNVHDDPMAAFDDQLDRAAEESAVVIMTAGYTQYMPTFGVTENSKLLFGLQIHPLQDLVATLPIAIYHTYEFSNVVPRSAGFATALVLIVIVMLINAFARIILWKWKME